MGAQAKMGASNGQRQMQNANGPRKAGRRIGAAFMALGSAGLILPAMAQSPNILPTREQYEQPAPPPELERREKIVTSDEAIERAPCPLASPDFSALRFTLKGVEFSGDAGFDRAALGATWADMQGQELSLAAVCEIRDRAATLLRKQGYLAAVQVPPQTIADGVIKLDIKSARMARIEVRGDAGANGKLLERYLSHLQDQPIFNMIDAERYLLLAREIPGMDARLTLRPGSVEGEVIGEVQVVRLPYMFDFALQNYGTREVGRWSGVARAQLAGITGMGDLTTISYYGTPDLHEQKVVQLSHEMRLGSEGLRAGISFSRAWTRPDINGLNIQSNAKILGLYAHYPLILSQTRRVNIGGGLDVINQDVGLGSFALTQDRQRVLYLRADGGWVDPASIKGYGGYSPHNPRWTLNGYIEARHGLRLFGASENCGTNGAACAGSGRVPLSRAEGRPDAFLLRAGMQAQWRPHPKFTLSAAPRAQWAADPLLSYEEFSGGNFTVGRGFEAGTIIGDSGAAVALEARYAGGIAMGKKQVELHPYAFFDAAQIWNKDASLAALDKQHLYSTGVGLRANAAKIGRMDLTFAVPLNKAGLLTERPDPRLLASFSTFFGIRAR